MKYTFNYKDGRNYDDGIIDGLRFEAEPNRNGDIIVKIFSANNQKIEMKLSSNESLALGHTLLSAVNSGYKISVQK